MSKDAFELLLKSNEYFAKGLRKEAAQGYREVLRRNPTPMQRQIAEEQLRKLGELPYSYAHSAKVIRRASRSVQKVEVSLSPLSGLVGEGVHTKKSRLPLTNQEKLLSHLGEIFSSIQGPSRVGPLRVSPLSMSSQRSDWAQPVRRKNESEEDYERRVKDYQIWLKHLQKHPDIDLNQALQLEQKSIDLEELTLSQKQRRRLFLRKRSLHLQMLSQANRRLPGYLMQEDLRLQRVVLFIWLVARVPISGVLMRHRPYDWWLKAYRQRRKRWPKLTLEFVSPWQEREHVLRAVRVNDVQAAKDSVPSRRVELRYVLDEAFLLRHKAESTPCYFLLHSGAVMWAFVEWYDPYLIGLRLKSKASDAELMLFRHAVISILEEEPKGWSGWATLGEWIEAHPGE